jgi:small subunit ribosomal protein S6
MTLPAPTYDLVLVLDLQAEQPARAKILADTATTIESGGELLTNDEWGERPLSYPIERRASAEYHLFQFHAGSPELLSSLDHTLRITDEVLRFRIIKLAPGTPGAPDMGSSAARREAPAAETPGAEAAAPPAEPAAPQAEPAAPQADPAAPQADPAEAAVGDPA